MKKNLLLRLCLIMIALLSFHSCRQDLLPEKETYNNSSAFQLTPKRISLNEAKHKAKLLPELEKAEKEVEKQKLNIQGKLVNVGNGIIIDTDEVVYIENGPGFHTYTFSVIRENMSVNAPVENLLLTPQPDGTYRTFHIVLSLSESDKAKIANRQYVDYKNKAEVTELASVNFSSLAQRSNCTPEYYSYPVPCADAGYRHLPGQSCQLSGTSGAAYWGTGVFWNCQNIPGPVDHVITPVDNSGPGGGAGGNGPDPCTTVAGNPGEVGIIDEFGCNIGVPTETIIPNPADDPCRKTKASTKAANDILHEPNISTEVSTLEGHAANSFTEYGMAIINTGTTTIAQDPYSNNDPSNPGTVSITVPPVGNYLASAHSHPNYGAPPPSVADLYSTLANSKNYPTFQTSLIFVYNGTKYALVVNDRAKAIAFLDAYPSSSNTITVDGKKVFNRNSQVGNDFNKIYDNYMQGRLPSYSGSSQNDGLESAFAEILQKYDAGVSIAKTDANGNLKSLRSVSFDYIIPASGGKKIIGHKVENCP
ncbi:hypothetical protein LNP04_09040 [Chryseobacterium sp. C-71]|uniref:hypothetical protein n=1 Tax=Chryseobacterium sp. C-71 TaxID=2893882 RepID=UPI001E5AD2A6|nr:hypothetical protein [Chryseobacterium sp. C-71]UFH33826.1 hypothetical protein LNP04_09040 [Chryseobacterium sp. C-71]